MPTKKMISVKECEKFAKINAKNAVNSYKQSKKRPNFELHRCVIPC